MVLYGHILCHECRMTDPSANINPLTGKPYSSAYFALKAKNDERPMERPAVVAQLFEELTRFPIVFLKAGTGTGKSINIGKRLLQFFRVLDSDVARIAVTQPRRLPATSISSFVAQLMDVKFGDEVGYKIKGNDLTSDKTVLAFVTEGQIFVDFTRDEDIHKWKGMVLDEVHTRTVRGRSHHVLPEGPPRPWHSARHEDRDHVRDGRPRGAQALLWQGSCGHR